MAEQGMTEPVLRCMECARLVEMKTIRKHGMCAKCGSKKVKRLHSMMPDEFEWLQENYPEFAKQFHGEEET